MGAQGRQNFYRVQGLWPMESRGFEGLEPYRERQADRVIKDISPRESPLLEEGAPGSDKFFADELYELQRVHSKVQDPPDLVERVGLAARRETYPLGVVLGHYHLVQLLLAVREAL